MYEKFAEMARNGEILGYRCRKCGMHTIRGIACPFCGSRDLEEEKAPGDGRVIAWTKIHVAPPEFSSETPYTVALIELSNGMRVMGKVEGDVDTDREVRLSGVKESDLGLSLVSKVKA